jgi:hypothetical protein
VPTYNGLQPLVYGYGKQDQMKKLAILRYLVKNPCYLFGIEDIELNDFRWTWTRQSCADGVPAVDFKGPPHFSPKETACYERQIYIYMWRSSDKYLL